MPSKKVEDGRVATFEEAEKIGKLRDQYEELRDLGKQGLRIMRDMKGGDTVAESLANISLNSRVLLVLARDMKTRHRLSADSMDVLIVMFLSWYDYNKVAYEANPKFDRQQWAFKDSWSAHKMLTKLRPKVLKGETPRDIWLPFSLALCFTRLLQTEVPRYIYI